MSILIFIAGFIVGFVVGVLLFVNFIYRPQLQEIDKKISELEEFRPKPTGLW